MSKPITRDAPASGYQRAQATFIRKDHPYGRVPAIQDPNTGIALWESGAFIEYLIENYDKDGTLTYTTFPEKYLLRQWLFFQVCGQGPYFGQAAWFYSYRPEKIESAKSRYKDQLERVYYVLDKHLQATDQKYLVGDKCIYAHLSFITWNFIPPSFLGEEYAKLDLENKYPAFYA